MKKKFVFLTILFSIMIANTSSIKEGFAAKAELINDAYVLDPYDDCDQITSLIFTVNYPNGLLQYEHYRSFCDDAGDGWCMAGDQFFQYNYDPNTLQLIEVIHDSYLSPTDCDIE